MICRFSCVGTFNSRTINELDKNIFIESICKFCKRASSKIGTSSQSSVNHRAVNTQNRCDFLLRFSGCNECFLDFLLQQ